MRERIEKLEKMAKKLEPGLEERLEIRNRVVAYAEDYLERLADDKAFFVEDPANPKFRHISFQEEPMALEELITIFKENIEESGVNAASGGHLAYIPGGGLYASALGDYLADITNKYAGVYYASPGAVRLENFLVRWMADIVGYPETAAGNITSGGSIANLTAIVTARDAMRIKAADIEKVSIYLTQQAHHSVLKAVKVAGLAEAQLRELPVDDRFRMDVDALRSAIKRDKNKGLRPFLVVCSAGTTDTGAVDLLEEIATIAAENEIWMHVDAAYGGFFLLTETGKKLFKGIEKSDSVVMDPHKGMFLPYGSGALIVKNGQHLYNAHQYEANYMQDAALENREWSPADLSPELTRHFRGLRQWLPMRLHGLAPFRAALEEKLLLTQYFYNKIKELPGFETGPEPELSVMIFRFVPESGNANELNKQLVEEMKKDGRIFLSSTTLDGIFWIRLAVLSFRTHLWHIDLALQLLQEKVKSLQSL